MNTLETSLELVNDKVQFKGNTRNNKEITMDYFPPLGDGEGYTGLELLLVSLAGCSSTAILPILRKMQKNISSFSINAKGIRREEHPTAFTKIMLDFTITSPNADNLSVEKAIKLAEEKFCPVWSMLKGNVEIISTYTIIKK